MFSKGRLFAISILFSSLVEASQCVKSLIFDNANSSVTIEFSEPTIIENIFLMKKVGSEEDLCVPVESLNEDIVAPPSYLKHVQKLKNTDPDSKKYPAYEKKVSIDRMDVLLSQDVFDEKNSFLFKIITLDEENELYSEEFVYTENGFEHKSSSDSHRWYSSPWPWIAIGFIIFSALLILKIAFC